LSIRAPVALRASCNATPQRMSAPMSSVASIASVRAFAPTRATVPLVSARPTTITAAGRRDDRENDGFQYVVNFAPIPSHTLPHAPRLHVYHRDRVIQVRRVTKVVKGGKQLRFRAVVVVGNENGTVGVGCASAKEVVMAVQKAAVDAKRNLVKVPLSKSSSFPHRFDGVFGAARVMLRPAAEGTGVIAGGAVRAVLELAGVKNGFGKQLGSDNALNNAKATVEGLKAMRTFKDVARERGLPLEHFLPGTAQ